MFTGIIQDVGRVVSVDKGGDWTAIIETKLSLAQTALGASIACDGVCLTVVEKTDTTFTVQISGETLSKTNLIRWQSGTRINLESALRFGDELGGHLLSGHVDGVARVVHRTPVDDSIRFVFDVPLAFERFLAPKGSITINGVSLTVNGVEGASFDVNIIPHTQGQTTLAGLAEGDEVNFEIDMIARYLERLLRQRGFAG